MKVSSFSTVLIFVVLMIIGAATIPMLNVKFSPTERVNSITVSYNWNNASAKIAESEVTSRLEGLISTVSGIKKIKSITSFGGGRIEVELKKRASLEKVRFEIASLIRRTYAKFPEGVTYPELSGTVTGEKNTPVMVYTLNADLPTDEIERFASDKIVRNLTNIKGVKSVEITGVNPFHFQVSYDALKLQDFGVTVSELRDALSSIGSGSIEIGTTDTSQIRLLTSYTVDNLENLPVKNQEGKIIKLSDVATIMFKERTPQSYYRINGLNNINIAIYADKVSNVIDVCSKIKEEMVKQQESFPHSFSALVSIDESADLQREINKITRRTLLTVLILFLFIFLAGRDLRFLFIIVSALLADVLISFALFILTGTELNLYSMAGLTVSLGMMTDTSIMMLSYYGYSRNRKITTAMAGALLTTIGALSVIFFLPEQIKLNLNDFAVVVIINLAVSFFVALLFVPALSDMIRFKGSIAKTSFKGKRQIVGISTLYEKYIRISRKYKLAFVLLVAAMFGLTYYLLPEDFGGNFYRRQPSRELYITASMPEGCTVQQLNDVVKDMENYLSSIEEIEMFTSRITAGRASLVVKFDEEIRNSSLPESIKGEVIDKAIDFGGANWQITGLDEEYFSNVIYNTGKSSSIIIKGYNYDKLYQYAQILVDTLTSNKRVKDIEIETSMLTYSTNRTEYYMDYDLDRLSLYQVTPEQLFGVLNEKLTESSKAGETLYNGKLYEVSLVSSASSGFDYWSLNNSNVDVNGRQLKFSSFGNIEKRMTGNNIVREDQQYTLSVSFNYMGSTTAAQKLLDRSVKMMNSSILPVGYSTSLNNFFFGEKELELSLFLIILVIAIIYFICSILFESLLQPLVIVFMIPISFIGVFFAFYLTEASFDQGGFASLIMLSGLVVNAGIYIINQYNINKRSVNFERRNPLKLLVKSYNYKLLPVSLTIIATILGMIPFFIDGKSEVFWYSFALGTTSGLLFSFLTIIFFLPIFVKK